jgi:predicted RNA-binding Zn-ribbon protein involved in translation (DUF1610 family)
MQTATERSQKNHARNQAYQKVELGDKCVFCGSTEYLERHHPDYAKPLDVLTVCRSCNAKLRSLENKKPVREPCPNCGSIHVVKVGTVPSSIGKQQRYRCNDCGKSHFKGVK